MQRTKLKNGKYIYHHNEGDFIANEIIKSNDYFERKLLRKLKKIISRGNISNVAEVGANIGNHVHYYLNNFDIKNIYAYEPLKQNLDILALNSNDKVKIFNYGLGTKEAKVDFLINDKNFGASTVVFDKKKSNESKMTTIEIRKWENINNHELDFIKVDIEGSEKGMLQKIAKTAILNKCPLMIEIIYNDYKRYDEIINMIDFLEENKIYLEYLSDFDFIFTPLARKKINSKEFIKLAKRRNILFEIGNIRNKYDSSNSKVELNNLKEKYNKLKKDIYIPVFKKLFWSKLYRAITFKRSKGKRGIDED